MESGDRDAVSASVHDYAKSQLELTDSDFFLLLAVAEKLMPGIYTLVSCPTKSLLHSEGQDTSPHSLS
jgi:hypothetical protein